MENEIATCQPLPNGSQQLQHFVAIVFGMHFLNNTEAFVKAFNKCFCQLEPEKVNDETHHLLIAMEMLFAVLF